MQTTIDRGGRVVVPKALRDRMRLEPGTVLEIIERDGELVMVPAPVAMHLERRHGVLSAVPDQPLPPLTVDLVRDTLDATRR
jgi:AbrB family looped-hinge helix DNA binding protein